MTALTIAGGGFIFAVVITELLVGTLGIRFRALFRGPLYAMFATSFFYPWLFSLRNTFLPELDYRYVILLFPFVVSLTILSLVPAIRRTSGYARKNGTPWRWPPYPYSIFVLAIVGLIGRTVMLTLSFDPSPANGIVGTWMFVPIFLSVTWVLFEIGVAEKIRELQTLSMMLMPFSLALAIAWPVFYNATFYNQITLEIGSPVWLTLLALVTIYFVAWIENIEGATVFLTMALLAAALLRQDGNLIGEFASIQLWPCLLLGTWSVASWNRMKRCVCWLLSGLSLIHISEPTRPY